MKKWITSALMILSLSFVNAQKDVTQFLDLPIDGYKTDMIQKLKTKGYKVSKYSQDILSGEFNGTDVNIAMATNNNKVWRIAVIEESSTNEQNIKIKFNNLIQQFSNNKRYISKADSTITEYTIPDDENISYEILVHKKRYSAVFYQKSLKYDTLFKEYNMLKLKENLSVDEKKRLEDLNIEMYKEITNSINKPVWFMIQEDEGSYKIIIYYDNVYNQANGDGL